MRGFNKNAGLDASAWVERLLECRAINTAYGTNYRPDDLDTWAESDIQEAIKLAVIFGTNT